MKNIRLLHADDEELIRKRVKMMLNRSFRIIQAATVAEALSVPEHGFDAAILDIMFPDGNGIELCKKIKDRNPHATVIISSSMETVDAWDDAFKAGADGYIEKKDLQALDPRKLTLTINNLVERNRLRKLAEETHKRQVKLLSILSHDVRAPFQALLGTLEMLRRNPDPCSATDKIEMIYQCADDQLKFINSLLELLRLESGGTRMRTAPLDLNIPINLSVQTLSMLISGKSITLHMKVDQDLPKINGDIARVSQLLNNLISNAVKFTPRGGSIWVQMSARSQDGKAGVAIEITDSGNGINDRELARIFQPFHRGRELGTEGEKGTGLGLAICREIMQLHGGSLEVKNVPTRGACFISWFPCDTPEVDAQILRAGQC
jgi:signal transduction histidine kinase